MTGIILLLLFSLCGSRASAKTHGEKTHGPEITSHSNVVSRKSKLAVMSRGERHRK